MTYQAKIIAGGKIVIPAEARRALGLNDGDRVMIDVEEGRLIVRSFPQVVAELQALVRNHVPAGVSLADDLIAERRAEAARE